MKRWIAAIALVALTSAAQAGGTLVPFKATYEGTVSLGSLACSMSLIHNADGSYTYSSTSHAIGLASLFFKDVITETSRFEVVDGRPRDVEYRYIRSGGKHDKTETIDFDWKRSVAHTVEGGRTRSTPLTPGVADRFLTQLILSLDAASGKLQGAYQVLDHGELSRFTPPAPERRTVRVPAGRYATVMVARHDKGSKRVMDFWFAPELHYLPVQVQQREPGKDTYTLKLTGSRFDTETASTSTGK